METKSKPKHKTRGGRKDFRTPNPEKSTMLIRKGNKNRRRRPVEIFTQTTMCWILQSNSFPRLLSLKSSRGVRETYQDHGQHRDGQSAETRQQSTPESHF